MNFEKKDWYPHLLKAPPQKWNHLKAQLQLIFVNGFVFSIDFFKHKSLLFHKEKLLYTFDREEMEALLVIMVNDWGSEFGKILREQVQKAQQNMVPPKLSQAFEPYLIKDIRFDQKSHKIIFFFSEKVRFIIENEYDPPRGVLVEEKKIRIKVPAKYLQLVSTQLFTQTAQRGKAGEWEHIFVKFTRLLKQATPDFENDIRSETKASPEARVNPSSKHKKVRSLRSP